MKKSLKWTKRISIGSLFIGWIFNLLNTYFPGLIFGLLMIIFYMISIIALMTDIEIRSKDDSRKERE